MSGRHLNEMEAATQPEVLNAADLLRPLIDAQSARQPSPSSGGIVVGELIALKDDGCTPLVRYSVQPGTAAIAARSVVDLHAAHIGRAVVLMFEEGSAARPIVMGVLHEGASTPLDQPPGGDHQAGRVVGEAGQGLGRLGRRQRQVALGRPGHPPETLDRMHRS